MENTDNQAGSSVVEGTEINFGLGDLAGADMNTDPGANTGETGGDTGSAEESAGDTGTTEAGDAGGENGAEAGDATGEASGTEAGESTGEASGTEAGEAAGGNDTEEGEAAGDNGSEEGDASGDETGSVEEGSTDEVSSDEADEADEESEEEKDLESESETIVSHDPARDISSSEQNMIGVGLIAAALILLAAVVAVLWIVLRRKKGSDEEMYDDNMTWQPSVQSSSVVKIISDDRRSPVRIGSVHDQGSRDMQQDSFGVSDVEDIDAMYGKGVLAIVADGMGGLSDGERMSQMVVVTMLQGFDSMPPTSPPASTLLGLVGQANDAVNAEIGPQSFGKCGSTVVAVIIKNRQLSWISVGDSHIYVYREGRITQLNVDHNYGTQLDEMVAKGEISPEAAASDPQRSALTSFIGIGNMELVDQNETPVALQAGDRVLLMSDGVYGTVDEHELAEIMSSPFRQSLKALDRAVCSKGKKNQDNYTCVVLEVK